MIDHRRCTGKIRSATVYGTFAAVPVFLLWVYVSWKATIMGGVVAALLPDYGGVRFERARPPRLVDIPGVAAALERLGTSIDGVLALSVRDVLFAVPADAPDIGRHRSAA